MNRLICVISLTAVIARGATFGTVVPIAGSPTDIVYDSTRNRVYIVDTTQNRIDVYAPSQRALASPIPVDAQPLSAAISRNGKYLYVTSFSSSVLDVIDLDAGAVAATVSLPARPEAVAVGAEGRVLVTTVGATTSDTTTRLLLYDPASGLVLNISNSLPAPATPTTSTTQVYNSTRSQLLATQDGKYIVGVNIAGSAQTAFVYETASASVLRSRSLTNISTVLSITSDGSRFMSGLSLFDASTMAIVAQQNAANSLYLFPTTANFSTQANQGGSVFAPDGSVLYSAFNIAPVTGSIATASTVTSQLMLSDPDNLLIQLGLQLPENLTGKMVITPDGATIYALSDSGILVLPVSTIYDNPIVSLDGVSVMVTSDQCGVTASTRTAVVTASNAGKGRITVSAATNTTTATSTQGLGGGTGPGGGGPGNIGQPPTPGTIPTPPGTTDTTTTDTTTTTANGVAPSLTTHATSTGATLTFTYNPGTTTSLGTSTPVDFVVTAPEAINIPYRIRTTQNYRNAEAAGTIVPASTGVSSSEGLIDMVFDSTRNRIYIANSGLNRVEVFDTVNGVFLSAIKVGQLPRSLAMTPDGLTLYVANTGGESISIIDLDKLQVTGTVAFPSLTYNASTAVTTPSVIAASLSGLQIVMSNGALWHVIGNKALPRPTSNLIGSTTLTAPRSLVATPGGEYVLLLIGTGVGYLYDAMSDDFVVSEQMVSTPIQGYYGPMSAGPKGAYYIVNGQAFNSALTPVAASNNATASTSHNSAVTAVDSTTYARFIQPTRTSTTAAVTTSPSLEIVNATTGAVQSTATALEGPLSVQAGTTRVNMPSRTMVVDTAGSKAYLLTVSGLSIVPLTLSTGAAPGGPPAGPGGGTTSTATRMQLTSDGVVNVASSSTTLAANMVVSIQGANLASDASASQSATLPTLLGGVCVTLDTAPIPLLYTASGQINAQIPPSTTPTKHTLTVRSIANHTSASESITVAKYAPAVYIDADTGQAAVYHSDGTPVNKSNPANRDEPLIMYASGLGPTTGGTVTSGNPSPSSPLAVTGTVEVHFGAVTYKQSAIIVDWSGLAPGLIGVYQLSLRVPGDHMKGDALPVTVKVGGVSSPTGSSQPTIAVQ
jgi:uncharacterized protein (TIGR03437 family)